MSRDLESLLDEVEEKSPGGHGRRWYDLIGPDEREFVDAVVSRALDRGEFPAAARVAKVLRREFGDAVSSTTVRAHFQRCQETHDERNG